MNPIQYDPTLKIRGLMFAVFVGLIPLFFPILPGALPFFVETALVAALIVTVAIDPDVRRYFKRNGTNSFSFKSLPGLGEHPAARKFINTVIQTIVIAFVAVLIGGMLLQFPMDVRVTKFLIAFVSTMEFTVVSLTAYAIATVGRLHTVLTEKTNETD